MNGFCFDPTATPSCPEKVKTNDDAWKPRPGDPVLGIRSKAIHAAPDAIYPQIKVGPYGTVILFTKPSVGIVLCIPDTVNSTHYVGELVSLVSERDFAKFHGTIEISNP